jgi:hypothetical protein
VRDDAGTRADAGGTSDGALDATDGVTTTGDVADRLRGQLASERAASDALRTRVGTLTRSSASLRSQLARERRAETSDDGVRVAPRAASPAPAAGWRGGGDTSDGSYSGGSSYDT